MQFGRIINFTEKVPLMSSAFFRIIWVFIFFALAAPVAAQEDIDTTHAGIHKEDEKKFDKKNDKASFSDRLFTGGDLGLQFGSITLVNLSPMVGYWLVEDTWAVGTGVSYLYYSNHYYNFSTSVYGGNLFTRYHVYEDLFAHGEYEVLNVEAFDGLHKRVNVPGLLLGGGYRYDIGEKSSATLLVLWNFMESYYTPYSNPVIRAGVNFGF